jgi:uncharacterized protein (DUF302 family)
VAGDGLITVASDAPAGETIDRLVEAVTAAVGMELRPTEVVLFGHARGGTPLMQDRQAAGIDLPWKALAWEDEHGAVWLTTNDPQWLGRRHGLGEPSREAVAALAAGLERVTGVAAGGI